MLDVFTKVILAGACVFTFAWVILAQRRTIKRLSDAYLRLTHFQRVLVALAVVICTVYAQKPSTNDVEGVTGTNEVETVGGASYFGGCGGPGVSALPPVGIALRAIRNESPFCELVSVSTNEGYSYAMPADGTIRGTWHLTGAYEDVQKIGLEGLGGLEGSDFKFPIGSQVCTSLWVYTWGKVRPQLKNASYEIAAVGAPMSAIPDVWRFWTAATSNGTYLLTWESFAAGRVTANEVNEVEKRGGGGQWNLTSAQIELRCNGDFVTRANDVESVWRRVIEPNPIGPGNPEDPDNPGMSVCPYGPVQDLSVIEEPDAYCWVDIVVNDADAWVRFEGDGPSNLADPSFAAKAGATNRVIILIGKTYKVTCDMPFSVTDKSDGAIEDWWDDDQALWLNWPVEIWSESDDAERPLLLLGARNGSGGRRSGFTMHVSPLGLGGSFAWTDGCCSISGSGSHFVFDCDEDCSCNGCYATGFFSYEGYHLPVEGDSCGCGAEEDDDDEMYPDEPLSAVGVSASFSKKVIFLENEYANTTNEVVPWHSETTELSCVACGGMNGGHVSMTIAGDSNLIQLGGQEMPFERDLEPYEVFSFTNTYKAVAESSRHEDIVATASFVENLTGWIETSIAKATAVRVEVEPRTRREGAINRHLLGVREDVFIRVLPNVSKTIEIGEDWNLLSDGQYQCPLQACYGGLQVCVDGCNYSPDLQIIEPTGIVCRRGWTLSYGDHTNEAGWIGMRLDLTVEPESVAFNGLAMVEEATDEGNSEGYFENHQFPASHDEGHGAGTWYNISDDNFFFYDCPRIAEEYPDPWTTGTALWLIPIAWGERGTTSMVGKIGNVPGNYTQVFTIDPQGGVRIDKFSQWVMRMPNNFISHSSDIILVQ